MVKQYPLLDVNIFYCQDVTTIATLHAVLKFRTPHEYSNVGIFLVWDFPIQTYSKHSNTNTNNNDCE